MTAPFLDRLWWLWVDAEPWLQGLFGGAGALLLWEAILKPNRERRAIAHALAEECSFNLQYAAGQRLYVDHNPKGLPTDFALSDVVFSSLKDKIGELRPLLGEIVWVYNQIRALNKLPAEHKDAFLRYEEVRAVIPDISQQPARARRMQELEQQMDGILGVYKSGLESLVDHLNTLLPKLRRESVPWWRVDYRFRQKRVLVIGELAKDVERLAAQRSQERGDHT